MLAYDCVRTNQTYLLVLRNVLYIESIYDNLIPPFILREAGLIVNEIAKIHCEPGKATKEDYTIQEGKTGLFFTMQLRSIFSYFPSRRPSEKDIEDGVIVVITPEGATWEPYDLNFAANKASMTNNKGEMRPPMYEHKEFVEEEDFYANLYSIMVMKDPVDHFHTDAVISTFAVQDVDFKESGVGLGLRMSEAAATAVKPFSSNWDPAFESMPVGQDQVSTIILSVSNTLDPQTFYDALKAQTAFSKFKMSVGVTRIISPEEENDLQTNNKPWNVFIDISSLESTVEDLEREIAAAATRAKGVTPERLSKIWSIDIETAKRTIDLTSQYVKHEGSHHLKHRHSTNHRMLQYKQIRTHFFMDTIQVTAKAISQQKNPYMQLFVSDTGIFYVYPMKVKTEIVDAVKAFAKEIRVPI